MENDEKDFSGDERKIVANYIKKYKEYVVRDFTKKKRSWCLTIFHDKNNPPKFDEMQMKYLIFGSETCPKTGTHHFQTYIYLHNPKTFTAFKKYCFKWLGKHPYISHARGTLAENKAYCSKDDDYKEYGEAPAQGERTDLKALVDDILEDKITINELQENQPDIYHMYGRTLEAIAHNKLLKKERTEMTEGIWLYGETGRGKSNIAFNRYKPYYLYDGEGNFWWDGYNQEENVIINEFRGDIKFETFLKLVDWCPYNVPIRSKRKIPFTSKRVIVTSSLSPEEIYKKSLKKNDNIMQFWRRFKVFELTKINDEIIETEIINDKYNESTKSLNDDNPNIILTDKNKGYLLLSNCLRHKKLNEESTNEESNIDFIDV